MLSVEASFIEDKPIMKRLSHLKPFSKGSNNKVIMNSAVLPNSPNDLVCGTPV